MSAAATAAAAEIGVLTAMLRREAAQPDHEEQFAPVLELALARIDGLSEAILADLDGAGEPGGAQ